MKRLALIVFVVVACGMALGGAPATQPDLGDLQRAVDNAKATSGTAEKDFEQRFSASAEAIAAQQDIDAKGKALDDARQNGTADDRLAASGDYNKARGVLNSLRAHAMANDAQLAQARAAYDQALATLAAGREAKLDERPTGYSDAQWTMAKAAAGYRGDCVSELQYAKQHGDAKTVASLEDQLKKLRAGDVVIPNMPRFLTDWKAGASGHMELKFDVNQVESKTEMLASPAIMGGGDVPDFWIQDYPTDGVADGQEVLVSGDFCISGTKVYSTVTGANRTVLILEKIDTSNLKPAVDYLIHQQSKEK
jgi:hypothetical protein